MEDNDSMIHDYIHFMIADLLREKGEVFLMENHLRESRPELKKLLNATTPDFIIESANGREKTLILDVYIGNKDLNEIKSKYKKLNFFADFLVIKINFASKLKDLIESTRLDYLNKNFQLFLTEYQYWKACMKLKKVIFNDVETVTLIDFKYPDDGKNEAHRVQFFNKLTNYAESVAARDGIWRYLKPAVWQDTRHDVNDKMPRTITKM